jgi:tryptophanyl-tRNA synthetase
MGASFNHLYGEHFVLPEAVIEDNVATLPGLDGRKMSKSYDNTIPLFASREQLKKLIGGIVTDSKAPGEAKSTEGSALFQIYQAFASEAETAAFAQTFAEGIAWGDAKQMLFERIDREIAPLREKYHALIAEPQRIEEILLAGATKARAQATPLMRSLRHAVGLRPLGAGVQDGAVKATKAATATLKQYREKDGKFYFKLLNAEGVLVLQSSGFDNPKAAGQCIAALRSEGVAALAGMAGQMDSSALAVDEAAVALALGQLG